MAEKYGSSSVPYYLKQKVMIEYRKSLESKSYIKDSRSKKKIAPTNPIYAEKLLELYSAAQDPWDIDKNKGISGAQRRLDLQNRVHQLVKFYDSWPTYEMVGTKYIDILPGLIFHLYPQNHNYIKTTFKTYYLRAVKEGRVGRQYVLLF